MSQVQYASKLQHTTTKSHAIVEVEYKRVRLDAIVTISDAETYGPLNSTGLGPELEQ